MGKCKKNSLKSVAASHNNASWHTDTDGFLEHSPRGGSLYYKGPALQEIILFWGWFPLVHPKQLKQGLKQIFVHQMFFAALFITAKR